MKKGGKEPNFFDRVYDIVARIPPGFVVTYGQVAALAGSPRAARQVGYAMKRAPSGRDLPCHRVVAASGALAPEEAFGGAGFQRTLLEEEGVAFLLDGRIDLENCLWPGPL